jgi:UDP-N-acetylmuramate dehydrogenase
MENLPEIQKNVKLAPLTSYKIGGTADFYCAAQSNNEIIALIKYANEKNISYFLFGGGFNTIFADKGFRGLIIHNKAKGIEVLGKKVKCDAGVMLGLVRIAQLRGLPGTVGGAIYGNAGANGVEIADLLESAVIMNDEGDVREVGNDYFEFGYRTSKLKKTNEIVLNVTLDLAKITKENGGDAAGFVKFRAKKQPKGFSAGSFFKNPSPDKSAGYLIDQAELKGLSVGGVEVSDLHGNWLVNDGTGTQKDVITLAGKIKKTVKDQFDIELSPENIIIDEHGKSVDI